VPDKGAKPPYSSCTLCLSGGKTCEPLSSGAWALFLLCLLLTLFSLASASRSHPRRQSPARVASSSVVAAKPLPPALSPPPKLTPLAPVDGSFMEEIPPVPLRGTPNAPLPELLAWHAEIWTSDRECASTAAANAAAVKRRRFATRRFSALIGIAFKDKEEQEAQEAQEAATASGQPPAALKDEDKGKGKGKEKERAPVAASVAEAEVMDEDAEMM
jgi:hypothetical protein